MQERSSSPTMIEPEALVLLKKVETVMIGLQNYQAECWTTFTYDPKQDGTPRGTRYEMSALIAVKPNRMRYDGRHMTMSGDANDVDTWARDEEIPSYTFACNGNTYWIQIGSTYSTDNPAVPAYLHTRMEPWEGFYATAPSAYSMITHRQKAGEVLQVHRKETEGIEGISCDHVFTHIKTLSQGEPMESQTHWYISDDGLVRRRIQKIELGEKPGFTRDAIVRNILVNVPTPYPEVFFTYTPPDGITHREQ